MNREPAPQQNGGTGLSLAPWLGSDAWTLPAMLAARAHLTPDAPAQGARDASGAWRATTWREFATRVNAVATGLRRHGLSPGDRVGIIAPTSADWDVAQLAVLAAGGTVVGIDAHDTAQHANDVAKQVGLAVLVAGTATLRDRIDEGVRARLRCVVTLDDSGKGVTLDDLEAAGAAAAATAPPDVDPDSAATIIFTSGTTGESKGIAYTHRQVTLAVASMLTAFGDIGVGSRLVCWLPLSNLFQRMLNACAIARGAQTFYVERPLEIMRELVAVSPHLFIAVPRFYEKLYAGIVERVEAASLPTRLLGRWALDVAARTPPDDGPAGSGYWVARWLAERIVYRRLRGAMGRDLRYMISGSAPMPRWLLERFAGIGLPVLEAYGLSENIIPVCANTPGASRLGTVGRPMPGSEVRFAADGEIWVRGPGVFGGYVGEHRATAAPKFDPDGFLATGDFGSMDEDGFVTLTGRKSEIFKTSTGRRVAPAAAEALLRALPYVEHALVCGAARPFPIALLAVAADRLRACAGLRAGAPLLEAAGMLAADVARSVAGLAEYARPAGVLVAPRAFTIEGGELTPNLKLRRSAVEAAYAASIDRLYRSLAPAGEPSLPTGIDGDTLLVRVA